MPAPNGSRLCATRSLTVAVVALWAAPALAQEASASAASEANRDGANRGELALEQRHTLVIPSLFIGLTAMSAYGIPASPSAGLEVDFQLRLSNFALIAQGRGGGIGNSDNKIGYGSFGVGARYFLLEAPFSPFAGTGLDVAYLQSPSGDPDDFHGFGLAVHGEIGMAFFQSSHVGAIIALRADLPTFDLKRTSFPPIPGEVAYIGNENSITEYRYVVPLSLNVGLTLK
jgi:hypothetical protein